MPQFKRKYRVTVSTTTDIRNTYTNYADYAAAQAAAKSQAAAYITTPPDRVGTLSTWVIEDLRVHFQINAGVSSSPNVSNIKIYNLNEDHRRQLQRAQGGTIKVEAGYEYNTFGTIFVGQVRKAFSRLDVVDWITEIEAADGEVAKQTCQIATSIKPSPWSKAVFTLADAISGYVQRGNLQQAVAEAVLRVEPDKRVQGDPKLPRGTNVCGNGIEAIKETLAVKGLNVSIDKGALLVLHPTSGRNPAFVLNKDTGLIGYPENTTDITKGGASQLKIKCLLNPAIDPGRLLIVDLPEYKNQTYRVESLSHDGDNWEGDWNTDIVAKRVQ